MNESGKIVYKGMIQGLDVVIRYPEIADLKAMHEYINITSAEKTYISYQGEVIPLEDEEKYLKGQIEKIKKGKTVQLLLIVNGVLSGISGVDMGDKVLSHRGRFGIMILKEQRGKGLGKLLMDLTLKEAKENLSGLKIITLEVFAENDLARNMYKNFGFTEYGKLAKGIKYKDGFSDEILMSKEVLG